MKTWEYIFASAMVGAVIGAAGFAVVARMHTDEIREIGARRPQRIHVDARKLQQVEVEIQKASTAHSRCFICGKIGHTSDMVVIHERVRTHCVNGSYGWSMEGIAHERCLVDAGWTPKMEQTGWDEPEQKGAGQ